MRKLADLIQSELKRQEICAVYNSELARVWPRSMSISRRMEQITRFAKQQKLAVTFYDVGLCAIFEKPRTLDGVSQRVLLLEGEYVKRSRKRRK
ncbi:MAG TPA: hypothetical protein VH170_05295 [Chthoniobacterales bacterium]|jgi:hypothetical protein|nr:hypothetical protein [Chthoniobacterales bacterium]